MAKKQLYICDHTDKCGEHFNCRHKFPHEEGDDCAMHQCIHITTQVDCIPCDAKAVHVDNYESLFEVLVEAFNRSAKGKGKERHADKGQPFEKQQICNLLREKEIGLGGAAFQIRKKLKEGFQLEGEAGVNEWLDCINYLAAMVIVRRENEISKPKS